MTDSIRPGVPDHWIQATVAQRHDDGWTAITDAGAELTIADDAVRGFRSLRTGQRLRVRLARPDAATADEATPLPPR